MLLPVWMFLLLMCSAMAQDECNNTFTQPIPREEHPDLNHLSDDLFNDVMQCPSDLECCVDGSFSCFDWAYLTCSCNDDCDVYGDCCWTCEGRSVAKNAESESSSWKCVNLQFGGSAVKSVYLQSKCSESWPLKDDVRLYCESGYSKGNDAFFGIPVTSNLTLITYRNGFCALCNYDVGSAVFWNAIEPENTTMLVVQPPAFMQQDLHRYLRGCSRFLPVDECPHGTSQRVSGLCHAHFAPVMEWKGMKNQTFYKNAYCALCNKADMDIVMCLPPEKMQNVSIKESKIEIGVDRLDLSSIFRTVDGNDTCFSSYNGRCYIQDVTYRYVNGTLQDETTSQLIRSYLTIACITISLICLAMKLIVYVFNPECRSFSSQCTLCLSMSLFFTQMVYLVFNVLNFGQNTCVAVAVVVHYGFLSTSFWTTVLSYDIWKTLILVRRPSGSRRSFFRYCGFGWGAPLIPVAVASGMNWMMDDSPFSPAYGRPQCFINRKWAHITFFLLPIIVALFIDIGFYVHTVLTIRKTEKQSRKFELKTTETPSRILLFVKLAFIMGVSWILGLLSAWIDTLLIDSISIVFIGLQGVYLFLGFRDHRHLWKLVTSSRFTTGLFNRRRSRSSTIATTDGGAIGNVNTLIMVTSSVRQESSTEGDNAKHPVPQSV